MSSSNSHIMERRSPKSSMPKSPLPRSPMPKSPFPKSPMPQSPELYEKYKSKCAYGLISFFHFGQSHSNKLISDDQRRSKRHAVEVKKIIGKDVSVKQQIKKTTAKVEHVKSDSEHVTDLSIDHVKATKTSRRPRRLPIYGCYDVATMGHAKPVHEKLEKSSSEILESAATEEVSNQVHSKAESDCKCRSTSQVRDGQVAEINLQIHMNEATEAFVNQKLLDAKHLAGDRANRQSKDFMDALEILNSNKDLFMKLLQDPNSLLVKHIDDLRNSQAKKQVIKSFSETKLREHEISKGRECERLPCAQNLKSSDKNQSKGTGDAETIVVLRPGPTSLQNCMESISYDSSQVHYRLSNVQQSVKPSFFPFIKMKRRLMNAMGLSRKEQQLMLTDDSEHKSTYHFQGLEKYAKGRGMDNVERNALDKPSFDLGRMAVSSTDVKREDQMDKVEIMESITGEEAASVSESDHESSNSPVPHHFKQSEHEKCDRTRVNLSGLLKYGNANLPSKQRPRTWDEMRLLPEYDGFLPTVSPRCKTERGCGAPQMRFSPYSRYEMVNRNKWRNQSERENSLSPPQHDVEVLPCADNKNCDQLQIIETSTSISDKSSPDVNAFERISALDNDSSPRGFTSTIEMKDSELLEEISPSGLPSKPDGLHDSEAIQSTYIGKIASDNEALNNFRLELPAENQTSPPSLTSDCLSSSFRIHRVDDLDKVNDRAEQPSPISVLGKCFMEDITSPSSTASRPGKLSDELSVLPLQIGGEEDHLAANFHSALDLKINSSTSMEEWKSEFGLTVAVLQASGFNLSELLSKCRSLCQFLDRSSCDHKFLRDYFIEVLQQVFESYLGCSPWLSLIKPKILSLTMSENIVPEVMKYVDRCLLSEQPLPTLDKLVEKDLASSAMWLDVRIDAEAVVSMVTESLLEELIIETAIE